MNELTKKAAVWFDDLETWKSFVQLAPMQSDIERVWLDKATEKLRVHFARLNGSPWRFQMWDVSHDTWWYLEEFGAESVGIGYGWRYRLCLGVANGDRIDRSALELALKQECYQKLVNAFGKMNTPQWKFPLEQYGDFTFSSENDGDLPSHELAWYAGNRTDEFVQQAVAKIEAFVNNTEITGLMQELNRKLLAR